MLYLPLAAVGMVVLQATGIFAAYAMANILSGILAYEWAKKTVRHQAQQQAAALT
mgnify:FL=1